METRIGENIDDTIHIFPHAVVLSVAKDLTKFINALEHCEVPRSEPDWRYLSARLRMTSVWLRGAPIGKPDLYARSRSQTPWL
ncbi:MAG: hypothetical protein DME46_00040 [Verrucomicrobia bacterium]|nr:MAG: hypothetical protein DME46_00040 [Verrucomicrobiota bacterium]